MALMTARRLVVRGRPPGRAAGRSGATSAQASICQVGVVQLVCFQHRPALQDSGKLFKHPHRIRPLCPPHALVELPLPGAASPKPFSNIFPNTKYVRILRVPGTTDPRCQSPEDTRRRPFPSRPLYRHHWPIERRLQAPTDAIEIVGQVRRSACSFSHVRLRHPFGTRVPQSHEPNHLERAETHVQANVCGADKHLLARGLAQ